MSDIGYWIKVYSDIWYNVGLRSLQSDIGGFDIRLSPISLITNIGLSAHLCKDRIQCDQESLKNGHSIGGERGSGDKVRDRDCRDYWCVGYLSPDFWLWNDRMLVSVLYTSPDSQQARVRRSNGVHRKRQVLASEGTKLHCASNLLFAWIDTCNICDEGKTFGLSLTTKPPISDWRGWSPTLYLT